MISKLADLREVVHDELGRHRLARPALPAAEDQSERVTRPRDRVSANHSSPGGAGAGGRSPRRPPSRGWAGGAAGRRPGAGMAEAPGHSLAPRRTPATYHNC